MVFNLNGVSEISVEGGKNFPTLKKAESQNFQAHQLDEYLDGSKVR